MTTAATPSHQIVGVPIGVMTLAHMSTVQPSSPSLGYSANIDVGRPMTSHDQGLD